MNTKFDWRTLLISPDVSLVEAVEQLDRGAKRILIVVDKTDTLLGTLTDGDVRRALIRRIDLTTPVSTVMNTAPRCATVKWSRTRLLSFMEQTDLLQLPILDEQNKVINICFLYDLLKKPRVDNPVCIMAGGLWYPIKTTDRFVP